MRFILTSWQISGFHNVFKNTDLLLETLNIHKNKNTSYLLESSQKLYPTDPEAHILVELLSPDWSEAYSRQLHVDCNAPFASYQICHFLNPIFSLGKKIHLPETSQSIQIPRDEFYSLVVFHREPRSTLLLYCLQAGATLVFPVTDFYQASVLKLLWESVNSFEEVVLYKALCKPILDNRCYVVAKNYKKENKEEQIQHYPLGWQYSIIEIYNQLNSYREHFLTKALELSKIIQFKETL